METSRHAFIAAPVGVPDGARRKELLAAIKDRVLPANTLTGTYGRK
ncbi:MAG: hypothetical protein L6R28_10600 [Planctomycetes bacterium]|nr:hypothetical protein [Planctomycetota bacterium]